MKLFRHSAALGICLFFAVVNQATAIDLWYDFETDSGTTVNDKLTTDAPKTAQRTTPLLSTPPSTM